MILATLYPTHKNLISVLHIIMLYTHKVTLVTFVTSSIAEILFLRQHNRLSAWIAAVKVARK